MRGIKIKRKKLPNSDISRITPKPNSIEEQGHQSCDKLLLLSCLDGYTEMMPVLNKLMIKKINWFKSNTLSARQLTFIIFILGTHKKNQKQKQKRRNNIETPTRTPPHPHTP